MFAKTVDPFIDLRDKPDNDMMLAAPAGMPEAKEPGPRGPSLSIYNAPVELPLTDKNLDKEITAEVKLKPHMIKKTVENGKTEYSYEIEVTAIRFTS